MCPQVKPSAEVTEFCGTPYRNLAYIHMVTRLYSFLLKNSRITEHVYKYLQTLDQSKSDFYDINITGIYLKKCFDFSQGNTNKNDQFV